MYDVNRELIEAKLGCLPEIGQALGAAAEAWSGTLLEGLAQERALHLAAEVVTDVGSALIDGFVMRDASSYEDIIDIIAMEGVITAADGATLRGLVSLRRALVQQYDKWPRRELHPLAGTLPETLNDFASQVRAYIRRELDGFSR